MGCLGTPRTRPARRRGRTDLFHGRRQRALDARLSHVVRPDRQYPRYRGPDAGNVPAPSLDRLDSFQPGTRMRAWLLRIASNAFLDVCRKRQRVTVQPLADDPPADAQPAEQALETAEQAALVRAALAELSETTRMVFHLRRRRTCRSVRSRRWWAPPRRPPAGTCTRRAASC